MRLKELMVLCQVHLNKRMTYWKYMNEHPLFAGTVFKIDEATEHAFKKMRVRLDQSW